MPLQQFDERTIVTFAHSLDSVATPGTYVQIAGSQSYDYRLDTIQLYNSDVVDHTVRLNNEGGSTEASDAMIVLVPAGSGYGSVPVDALAVSQPAANHYLYVYGYNLLYWTVDEAITATKAVHVWCQGGGF